MKFNRIIIFFLTFFIANFLYSQDLNIARGSFFYPSLMQKKEYKHEFSVALAKLPEEQIEATSAWIYAPLFTYHAKYGLPKNFNLSGEVSTNIITYFFKPGVQWGYDFGKLSVGLNANFAFWFGQLHQFGFDSKVKAWDASGGAAVGIKFEKFTLTFLFEADYITSLKQKAGDIVTTTKKNFLNALNFSVFIEQPVWKDNFMTLGVRFNHSKIYWPAWAVFPSWDRFFFVPEVFVGFAL